MTTLSLGSSSLSFIRSAVLQVSTKKGRLRVTRAEVDVCEKTKKEKKKGWSRINIDKIL